MKVLGKLKDGCSSGNFAIGGNVVLNATWVHVETYSGAPVGEDKRCFLKLGAGYIVARIMPNNGEYMSPEMANSLVKEIATKDLVDLDDYDMAFSDIGDIIPESICVTNEVDENYCAIPLEVVSV